MKKLFIISMLIIASFGCKTPEETTLLIVKNVKINVSANIVKYKTHAYTPPRVLCSGVNIYSNLPIIWDIGDTIYLVNPPNKD